MNERLKILRKELKLSQEAFGNRLGVTKTTISRLEKGARNLTSQMIVSICREFDVNEDWLKTGSGEIFTQLSKAEKVAAIVGKALRTDNQFMQNVFIALGQLSTEEWKVVEKIVDEIKSN